jgi:small GTP-binding protein
MKHVKGMLVGDDDVGKLSLLNLYCCNVSPGEYAPAVFGNHSTTVMIEDEQVHFELWYVTGRDDYAKLRPMSYPGTDVFMFCFSVVNPASLEHVKTKWLPEVKEHCPTTPYFLVGMMTDLREIVAANPAEWKAKGMEVIPESEGEKMKTEINAEAYIECSAKKWFNHNEVFQTMAKISLHLGKPGEKQKKGGGCEVA